MKIRAGNPIEKFREVRYTIRGRVERLVSKVSPLCERRLNRFIQNLQQRGCEIDIVRRVDGSTERLNSIINSQILCRVFTHVRYRRKRYRYSKAVR